MTASARPHRTPRAIEELYLPQVEQFGVTLQPRDGALHGAADNDRACGELYVYRVGGDCLVASHRITVKRDLLLSERQLSSLCISTLSADSLALCPIAPPEARKPEGNVAVFGQERGESTMWLRAGSVQSATSVTLLPQWLGRLEPHERTTAHALLEAPGTACDEDAACALDALMRSVSPPFGGHLAREGELAARVLQAARLALRWHDERARAETAAGTREQAQLVRAAKRHVALHLDAPLALDGLARDLLTSRSRLCAAFKQETGCSLGAYVRRARMRRACELLPIRSLGVADVARAVGYPRTSSFTVAFERETGLAPTAWRERHAG